jgi:uncharacterized protein
MQTILMSQPCFFTRHGRSDGNKKPECIIPFWTAASEGGTKWRRQMKRKLSMILVLLTLLGAIALVLLLGCSTTRIVIRGTAHGSRTANLEPSDTYELIDLRTKDGTKIFAQFGVAFTADGKPDVEYRRRPTVIYFYPGGGYMRWSQPQFNGFRKIGVNVLMPEYPGYGMSEGQASEAGLYAAADAAYIYIHNRQDLSGSPIFAAGWSAGGACAVHIATYSNLYGVILFETLPSWRESGKYVISEGRHRLSGIAWCSAMLLRSLPSSVTDRFFSEPKLNTEAQMSLVHSPILIVYGEDSELVSKAMVEKMALAASAKTVIVPIGRAGHFDLFAIGDVDLWKKVNDWITSTALSATP